MEFDRRVTKKLNLAALYLETSDGSQKSAQDLGAPGTIKKMSHHQRGGHDFLHYAHQLSYMVVLRPIIIPNKISGISGDLMAMEEQPDAIPLLKEIILPTLVIVGQVEYQDDSLPHFF